MLDSETIQGGSSDTFYALLRLVDIHGFKIIIIENSDELVGDEQADWRSIVTKLQDRGYRCRSSSDCLLIVVALI